MMKNYFRCDRPTFTWALFLLFMGVPLLTRASSDAVAEAQFALSEKTFSYTAPARNGTIDLTLERDGLDVVLRDNNTIVCRMPMTIISTIEIGGPDRTNTILTIDYGSGSIPVPIDYHPGALGPQTDNLLNLRGSGGSRITHTATGPHDGTITVENTSIKYSNLTPILDTTPATNYTFNAFLSSTANIGFVDGGVQGGFQATQINDGGTSNFETTSFANKVNVTFNVNGFGSTVTVNSPITAVGLTQLTLTGNQGAIANGASTFNITPDPSVPITVTGNLDSGAPTDALIVDVTGATNINITANYSSTGISGSYTFGNRQTVTFSQMATISPTPTKAAPIPTLSKPGMIILLILLALGAFFALRGQRHSKVN